GRPLQCVHEEVELEIERHDWSGMGAEEQKEAEERLLEEERRRGFALERAPLMRLLGAKLDGERTLFVWEFHHLLLDGWSTSLVMREVFEQYEAAVEGRRARLGAAGSHEAYVKWLGKQDRGAAEEFWRKKLEGIEAATGIGARREGKGEVREEE